jgi:dTDP-4-dehydrorhamnose 3,5-epimerase
MRFEETHIPDVRIIHPERIEDHRGFFARGWCSAEFSENGLADRIAQTNISYNVHSGTLRGIHWQKHPHREAKTIRCVRGAVYDVAVDIRPESPTHKQWVAAELSAENRMMLYVPEGFGHAFLTLEDHTEVHYMVSEHYCPRAESGARYDDSAFSIAWPKEVKVISDKDLAWPAYMA